MSSVEYLRKHILFVLGASLTVVFILAASFGSVLYTPFEIAAIIGRWFEPAVGEDMPLEDFIFLTLRLPRVVLAMLVGASLAIGGAAMQGLFRNSLADPMLTGASAGGAVAAIIVLVSGTFLAYSNLTMLLPAVSFVGSLTVVFAVYAISQKNGHVDVPSLLLAGIAFNALAASVIGFLIVVADNTELRGFVFWMLGSLGGATWLQLGAVLALVVPAMAAIAAAARPLDAMALGEPNAMYLGVQVERWKMILLVAVAICAGASVAVTGIIGFVGLIAPHLMRLLIGPNHRKLLPASMLFGALVVLAADLLARTLASPVELPIGVITALMGVPLFLFLISSRRLSVRLQ